VGFHLWKWRPPVEVAARWVVKESTRAERLVVAAPMGGCHPLKSGVGGESTARDVDCMVTSLRGGLQACP